MENFKNYLLLIFCAIIFFPAFLFFGILGLGRDLFYEISYWRYFKKGGSL